MRWGIIAALVFCCGFCAAEEIDLNAIRKTLDVAVSTYFDDVQKVDNDVSDRIDRLITMAGSRGSLEEVEELQQQRATYLRTGLMPEGRIHLITRRKAEFGINRAKSRLDQAYEEAIENLTEEGRYTDARRIKNEYYGLEQKLKNKQEEFKLPDVIKQARVSLNIGEEQLKKRKSNFVITKTDLMAADGSQSLPNVLKDVKNELTPDQDYFIRRIPFLTDEIASSLSNVSGHIYFNNLREFSGHHAKIIFSNPTRHPTVDCECPTEFGIDFVVALEQLVRTNPENKFGVGIRESFLAPEIFERLLKISQPFSGSKFNFQIPFPTLDESHIQIYKSLEENFRTGYYIKNLSIRPKDYYFGHEAIIELGPWNNAYINGGKKTLEADMLPNIEHLEAILCFRNFKNLNSDLLPVLVKRGLNQFPTVFERLQILPQANMQSTLEKNLVFFVDSIADWKAKRKNILDDFVRGLQKNQTTSVTQKMVAASESINSVSKNHQINDLFLTDEIANSLADLSGRLYFNKLQKISGRHTRIILSKENGPSTLNFHYPTEINTDFVAALEDIVKKSPLKSINVSVRESILSLKDFERLLLISTLRNSESKFHFGIPFKTLTDAHIQIFKSIERNNDYKVGNFRSTDFLQSYDVIRELGPWAVVYVNGHSEKEFSLAVMPDFTNFEAVIVFCGFPQINSNIFEMLQERGSKNLPTIFFRTPQPAAITQSDLEDSLVFFGTKEDFPPKGYRLVEMVEAIHRRLDD